MAHLINLYGVQTLTPTTDNNFSLVYDGNVRSENNNEVRLLVDTSQQVVPAPVNIYLPSINSFRGIWTLQLYVVDISGTAGTNAINIIATGGDNVDGVAQTQVASAYGNCVLTIASLGYWTTYGSASGGGGGGGGITLPYADFFNLITNNQLVKGQTYRINDYRSVNFVNGYNMASAPPFVSNLLAGTIDNSYIPPSNTNGLQNIRVLNLADDSLLSANQKIVKYDSNGVPNLTFNTNCNQAFDFAILGLAQQTDGKILAGGNFTTYGATTCGAIARFNADGTFDTAFNINTGTGFNGQISSIVQLASGKILVGGFFTQFNGNPIANNIACLNANGTLDNAFNIALGTGFNGEVLTLFEQADGNILIGGQFTSLDITPSNYLIRIDPNGIIDGGFVATLNFAGGLNFWVKGIIEQPDTNILLIGEFNLFNGVPYNYICRIDTFGNDDFIFNANTGTGFDVSPQRFVLQNDGSIVLIGSFTSFNSNPHNTIIRIDSLGNYDSTFVSVFPTTTTFDVCLKQSGNIIFSSGITYPPQQFIYRLFATPQPANYNADEIYTSSIVETLIVKAVDGVNIEQNVYSEQFPQDIIEYNPQVNKIGLPLSIQNGNVLPDTTIVSGFDLQWDGTNVYFDMPNNYPVLYGHFFYISIGGTYLTYDPVKIFVENIPVNYGGVYTSIEVTNNQTRVILKDYTFAEFSSYLPNTLVVDAVYELGDSYGCITRRRDTILNNTIPYDFRGVACRRYQSLINQTSITPIGNVIVDCGIGFYSCYPNERGIYTGVYSDFILGSNPLFRFKDVIWNGTGGADCGYYFIGTNYLVVLGDFDNAKISLTGLSNITFGNCINTTIIGNWMDNCLFLSVLNSDITSNAVNDNLVVALDSCTINGAFASNNIGNLTRTTIIGDFIANTIGTNVIFVDIFIEKLFQQNSIGAGTFTNNTFTYFQGNTIFGDFTFNQIFFWEQNTQDGGNLNNNEWRYGAFNTFTSISFNNNSIKTGSFNAIAGNCSSNIIDVLFNENTINNQFNNNSIGSGFQRNQINADFQYNTFLEEAVDNIFNTRFYDNRCGSKFSNNNIAGFVEQNNFGTLFNGNSINANQFYNNNFIGRMQSNNWRGGVINVTNNFIATECISNVFEGNTMYNNSISGYSFNGNNIGGAMFNNNIIGGMINCITGAGTTYKKNTIHDLCSGIDFTPATFVYGTLNCTLQEGNLGNTKLSYLDEATNTYIIVLPTA